MLSSHCVTPIFLAQLLTFSEQAVQLAYIMEDRLKEAAEQANKETASKDVAKVTAKEKITATKISEERAQVAKRVEEQAEQ